MPDNASVTKIVCRVLDQNLKELHPKQEYLADLDSSSVRKQFYNAHITLKLSELPSTALLYIQVQTFSRSSRLAKFIGVSYLPLFMDTRSQEPATVDNNRALAPLLGLYQMPLFYKIVSETAPFIYEKIAFNERVPNASILLRAKKVAAKPDGSVPKPEPRPEYKQGVYSNKYFNLNDEEKEIMRLRGKQKDAELKVIANEVLTMMGKDPGQMDPSQKLSYFKNLIKCDIKSSGLVDLNYHSQYLPSYGFRFNIEAIHDNKM